MQLRQLSIVNQTEWIILQRHRVPLHFSPVFVQGSSVFLCGAEFGHVAQGVVDVVDNRGGDDFFHAVCGGLPMRANLRHCALVGYRRTPCEESLENLLGEIHAGTPFIALPRVSGEAEVVFRFEIDAAIAVRIVSENVNRTGELFIGVAGIIPCCTEVTERFVPSMLHCSIGIRPVACLAIITLKQPIEIHPCCLVIRDGTDKHLVNHLCQIYAVIGGINRGGAEFIRVLRIVGDNLEPPPHQVIRRAVVTDSRLI